MSWPARKFYTFWGQIRKLKLLQYFSKRLSGGEWICMCCVYFVVKKKNWNWAPNVQNISFSCLKVKLRSVLYQTCHREVCAVKRFALFVWKNREKKVTNLHLSFSLSIGTQWTLHIVPWTYSLYRVCAARYFWGSLSLDIVPFPLWAMCSRHRP